MALKKEERLARNELLKDAVNNMGEKFTVRELAEKTGLTVSILYKENIVREKADIPANRKQIADAVQSRKSEQLCLMQGEERLPFRIVQTKQK